MRPDLAKLTTEASRNGSARAYKAKFGGKVRYVPDPEYDYDDEFGGFRSSSRCNPVHRGDYKYFSDVLRPLVGVIRKNVGRPWNDVYSEFCRFLDRRSVSGIHIFGHLMNYVTTKGLYEGADGVVYEYQAGVYDDRIIREWDAVNKRYIEKRNPNGAVCLAQDTPVTGFYVHPTTGILYENKEPGEYKFSYRIERKKEPVNLIQMEWDYETVQGPWGRSTTYERKYCSKWYERELCGRRPRSKFYAWFNHSIKKTTKVWWDKIGLPVAKNAHFDGKELIYVDSATTRMYKAYPEKYWLREDGFWYMRREETTTKTTKRSVNRKEMARIRTWIAQGKGINKESAAGLMGRY